jgi:hypothetical protein
MNINVDINLLATLVECVEKQAILDKQPPEVQEQWKAIFATTANTARAALNQHMKTVGHGDPRRTETGMGPMFSPGDTPYL